MIEIDSRVAVVTLVAVSKEIKPDGELLDEVDAAWNELSGFTITRSVLLEEGDDAASLTAAVEGSVLTLALPKLKMTAPDLDDIDEEVPVVSDVEPPLEDKE